MKEVAKIIANKHQYDITAEYWARIGMMIKRYGEETVIEALNNLVSGEIPLSTFLSKAEKRCQVIITDGGLDDLAEELLA